MSIFRKLKALMSTIWGNATRQNASCVLWTSLAFLNLQSQSVYLFLKEKKNKHWLSRNPPFQLRSYHQNQLKLKVRTIFIVQLTYKKFPKRLFLWYTSSHYMIKRNHHSWTLKWNSQILTRLWMSIATQMQPNPTLDQLLILSFCLNLIHQL